MPFIYWLDTSAFCLSAFLAGSIALLVLGSGLRRPLNRRFALFAAVVAIWAVDEVLLRLAFLLGRGNIRLMSEFAALGSGLMGPLLLLFASRYVGSPGRVADIAGGVGLAVVAVLGVPLFDHHLVLDTVLTPNGAVVGRISSWGAVSAIVPVAMMGWAGVLLWRHGRIRRERYLAVGAFLLFLGLVVDGVLGVALPILSLSNTAGVVMLGYAVMSAHIFNPLREANERLEQRVDERERAVLELRERTTRLELLADIGRKTTAILDVGDLVDQSVILIRDAFDYSNVAILMVEDGHVVLRAVSLDEAKEHIGRVRLAVGKEGITGWAAAHAESVRVDDVRGDERYRAFVANVQTRSELAIPILIRDRVLGVLDLQSADLGAFNELDVSTMEIVAGQLAVAIENARSYEAARQELAERVRAEAELRESEQQFRDLSDQSPNMIFINQAGRVVYVNRQCETVLGIERARFIDPEFRYMSLIAPEYRSMVAEGFRRHSRGEEVVPCEYDLLTAEGRRIHVVVTTKLISYRHEPAILGIVTDLSSIKHAERLLTAFNRAATAMERALTPGDVFVALGDVLRSVDLNVAVLLCGGAPDTLRMGYANYDLSGLLRIVSDAGLDPENAAVPLSASDVLRRCVLERASILAEGTAVASDALAGLRIDGLGAVDSIIGGQAVFAPLVVNDEVEGVLAVRGEAVSEHDIPTVTAFAHQIAASWRKATLMLELKENLGELKQTQEQLLQSQKMEAFGKLAGGIAHDFNNLLTAIGGYTDLLLQEHHSGEARQNIVEIRKASNLAASLTQQLLAFSRKQMLRPTLLDINEVMGRLGNMLRRIIGEHIDLVTDLEPGISPVRADPSQIDQVIMNLCLNAKDAMSGGGRLTVLTRNVELNAASAPKHPGVSPGAYVLLAVSDTGRGMDEELQRQVFEPFFTTKEQGKGTGLGLATVHGIVHQSGGHILVDSEVGRGSTFTVYLPRAEGRCDPRPAAPAEPEKLDGTEMVLVVEDEDTVRGLVERVLNSSGYTVLTASQAAEALTLAREYSGRVSLVLTDVVMPGGVSGPELADQLLGIIPGVRVLYMSGYAENAIVHGGVLDPDVAFLPKPFTPEVLRRKIREVLDATPGT